MHFRITIIRHKHQLYGTNVQTVKVENLLDNLSTKSVDNFMDNLASHPTRELIKGFQQIDQFSIRFINFQYNQ